MIVDHVDDVEDDGDNANMDYGDCNIDADGDTDCINGGDDSFDNGDDIKVAIIGAS